MLGSQLIGISKRDPWTFVYSWELKYIRFSITSVAVQQIMYTFCGRLAVYALVVAILWTSEGTPVLSPDALFPALALLNVLRIIYFEGITDGMRYVGEMAATLGRIQVETRWLTGHYDDVIMVTIASQITSLTIVYSWNRLFGCRSK